MKQLVTVAVSALLLGLGVGCGQALIGGGTLRNLVAQSDDLGSDEETAIAVTRLVTPTVVGIQTQSGSGSGVIIRSDGVIVTNSHVVANARQVLVSLADGTEFTGTVLGRDPTIDIAVVRIQATDLPAAPTADSDRLQVGQSAIAIGNPLGFERTVTRGIVSGLNRALGDQLDELIQTDAAINPGNSGGPLLNSKGQVIGINTAVVNPGIASGLGFAVPINLARNVADQLLTTGVIRRAYLGISYEDLTREIAARLQTRVNEGLVVGAVGAGSPAAAAGLRKGDIITRIDTHEIDNGGDFRRHLRQRSPGEAVTITADRQGREIRLEARLGEVIAR